MGKGNVAKFFKGMRTSVVKHSPEILTGLGIAGFVASTVLAVRATPKALKRIEAKKEEENKDSLTPLETVKATWTCYIPTVLTATTSAACLIGAHSIHVRRHAALAAAYKISETALTEYREKVIETIGEKKDQYIQEQIDKDRIEKNPVSSSEVIVTGKGKTLCYDYFSGRYFDGDIEQIKKSVNVINGMLLRDDYVSLNDLYDEIDLPHTGTGDILGWSVTRVGRDLIQPRISSQIADDGRPAIVMSFDPAPDHNYSRFA